jgi:glutamyl-tRNA reductase
MTLLSIGINHETAPVDIREKVAFSPENLPDAIVGLKNLTVVKESVIVSTCNRTEIYCDTRAADEPVIQHWLAEFHGLNSDLLDPYLYLHHGTDAARHLFRVACGLDSLVLGEPQILGQLKDSFEAARDNQSVNSILDRLFQHSFSVAKRVRTDTDIGSNPVSVAFAAVSLSRQIFGKLDSLNALLIGAGETIELVARHLRRQSIGSITIANRSLDRAQALAEQVDGKAVGINTIPEQLVNADIVISSTASQLPILGKGATESALRQRKHRPIFMVDLAVPRDIEAEVGTLEDIYLYTVDDLKNVVDENMKNRVAAADSALEIINGEVSSFEEWLRTHQSADHIRNLRQQAEMLKAEMLERAQSILLQENDPGKALEFLANNLTNKLIHGPTMELRKAIRENDQPTIDLLKSLIKPNKTN